MAKHRIYVSIEEWVEGKDDFVRIWSFEDVIEGKPFGDIKCMLLDFMINCTAHKSVKRVSKPDATDER
jgi:hypothetical protein